MMYVMDLDKKMEHIKRQFKALRIAQSHFSCSFEKVLKNLMDDRHIPEEAIQAAMTSIRATLRHRPWRNDESFAGIDFNDVIKCCAYLRMHAACYTELTRCAMRKFLHEINLSRIVVEALLKNKELKIVSAGGGPGNDLIGCSVALFEQSDLLQKLNLTAIDLNEGWSEIFATMFSIIETDNGPIGDIFNRTEIDTSFVVANLANEPDDIQYAVRTLSNADLIIMIKVMSMVPLLKKEKISKTIFTSMQAGAFFFFVDKETDFIIDESNKYHMALVSKFDLITGFGRHKTPYKVCILQKCGLSSLFDFEPSSESDADDTVTYNLHP